MKKLLTIVMAVMITCSLLLTSTAVFAQEAEQITVEAEEKVQDISNEEIETVTAEPAQEPEQEVQETVEETVLKGTEAETEAAEAEAEAAPAEEVPVETIPEEAAEEAAAEEVTQNEVSESAEVIEAEVPETTENEIPEEISEEVIEETVQEVTEEITDPEEVVEEAASEEEVTVSETEEEIIFEEITDAEETVDAEVTEESEDLEDAETEEVEKTEAAEAEVTEEAAEAEVTEEEAEAEETEAAETDETAEMSEVEETEAKEADADETEETAEAEEAEEGPDAITEEEEEDVEQLDAVAASEFVNGVIYVLGIQTADGIYAVTNNSGSIVATLIASAEDATDAMKWTATVGSRGTALENGGTYLMYAEGPLTTRSNAASSWAFSGGSLTYSSKGTTYYTGGVSGGGFLCSTDSSVAAAYVLFDTEESTGTPSESGSESGSGSSSSSSTTYTEIDTKSGSISTKYVGIVDPDTGNLLQLDMGSFGTVSSTVAGDKGSRTATMSKSTSVEVAVVDGAYTLRMQDPPDNWNYIYVKDGVLTADDKDNPGEATSFNNWKLDEKGRLYYDDNGTKYYIGADGKVSTSAKDVKAVLFGGDTAVSGGGGGGGGHGSSSEIIATDATAPQIIVQPEVSPYMTEGSGYAAPVYSITAALPADSTATSITFTWYVNGEAQPAMTVAAAAGEEITNTLTATTLAGQSSGVYPVYCVVSNETSTTAEDGTVTTAAVSNTSLTVNFIVCKGINNNSFLTYSDVHETFSNIGHAINNIMSGDGLIPALVVCTGDWSNGHQMGGDATSENYATTRDTYLTRLIAQSGGIDTVFVAGNHDNSTAAKDASIAANLGATEDSSVVFDSAVAAENGNSSKNLENLIVYGINYEDIQADSGYSYEKVIPELEAYLENLRSEYAGQLIVISAHAGLHKLDNWGGKDSYNVDKSDEMVELLNKYAQTGMNITFFFGHDHSKGENELIKTPGETIESTVSYSDQTTKENTLYFTYGHAGYITSNIGGQQRYTEVELNGLDAEGGSYSRTMSTIDSEGKATVEADLSKETDAVTAYQITEGDRSNWEGDMSQGIEVKANADFDLFKDITVDGAAVSETSYTVSPDGQSVTFKPEYLNTLDEGMHNAVIGFNNGNAETPFIIGEKPEETSYEIVEGDGTEWKGDTPEGLTMVADGDYALFVGVSVDDVQIDESNYTSKAGSTYVTLKPEYLKTLTNGQHTLKVLYFNGFAEGKFFVDNGEPKKDEPPTDQPGGQPGEPPTDQPGEAPADQPGEAPAGQPGEAPAGQPGEQAGGQPSGAPGNIPKTGDENNMALWILVMAASCAAMAFAVRRLAKNR